MREEFQVAVGKSDWNKNKIDVSTCGNGRQWTTVSYTRKEWMAIVATVMSFLEETEREVEE